jgi:hypothetical protein
MSIERLLKVVAPPERPDEPFSGPWEPTENFVGSPLPQDYKDFVRLFGSGSFMDFLGINVPRVESRYVRFETALSQSRYLFQQALPPEDRRYPIWPDPGGLILVGHTDWREGVFWVPNGDPSSWTIAIWDAGWDEREDIPCNLTDFLAGLADGSLSPNYFPEDLLPCDAIFTPYSAFDDDDQVE